MRVYSHWGHAKSHVVLLGYQRTYGNHNPELNGVELTVLGFGFVWNKK